jgi:surface carbohydrate biosynthesis protein (TIGR04326 family)
VRALLLAAGTPGTPESLAVTDAVDTLVVHWDAWHVPEGHVSLPALLARNIVRLRGEHATWAYETGLLPTGNGETLADRLAGGAGLSMWWCSLLYERHPKMTPGLYTVYRLRMLELTAEEEGAGTVRLHGGDGILRASLEAWCEETGRRLVLEGTMAPTARAGFLERCYRMTPALVRCLVRYVHWRWTVRRLLPPAKGRLAPTSAPSATIATYFPNVDKEAARQGRYRSRYWETLHDVLNAETERGGPWLRWLFIRFPSPDMTLAECIALRDRFRETGKDGASFHYLEEFLTPRGTFRAVLRHLRIAAASFRCQGKVRAAFRFPGSKVDLWPHLGQYWAESFRGWRCLERCIQHEAFEAFRPQAGPQRWTLFPLENCPWERMLTHTVHASGHGPVFGAQHSTLRPTDFRYFDDPRTFSGTCAVFQPDAIRGNGEGAFAQWRDAGVPDGRLGVVEALRYGYLAKAANASEDVTERGSDKPRLLVVTSFFRDETEAHLALLAEAILAGALDGHEVLLKAHPYLPVQDRLRELLKGRAPMPREVEGAIGPLLTRGTTVWASNSTTVALEAAIRGLVTLVMPPPEDFDLCPLQEFPELVRTACLEDLRKGLAKGTVLAIPDGYLALDPELPRWKALLGLAGA